MQSDVISLVIKSKTLKYHILGTIHKIKYQIIERDQIDTLRISSFLNNIPRDIFTDMKQSLSAFLAVFSEPIQSVQTVHLNFSPGLFVNIMIYEGVRL